MRDHARQRAEKLERISNMIMRINVTLTIEGDRQMAEAAATVRRHGEIVAKSESHDMYASINQALTRLEKQLQKLGGRIKNRRESGRGRRAGELESREDMAGADEIAEEEEE